MLLYGSEPDPELLKIWIQQRDVDRQIRILSPSPKHFFTQIVPNLPK
jgi:hypothetical protein